MNQPMELLSLISIHNHSLFMIELLTLIQDFQDWYNQSEKEGVKRYKLECLFLKIKTLT